MAKKISDIEGIGPKYAETLQGVGIGTTDDLLQAGNTPAGRKELAKKTGMNEKTILKWVNMADLFRIKGVASQYAELLEAAGVDTVKELRSRNTENLALKMHEVNVKKRLVRQAPSAKSVGNWIDQAKSIPPMVNY